MSAVRTAHTRKLSYTSDSRMTDELHVTHDFFWAHVLSEEPHDITTSRVRQGPAHQVGDSDGMVVLGLVPAQNGRNVVIRLDTDSAPASRPFARQLANFIHVLSDVFFYRRFPGANRNKSDSRAKVGRPNDALKKGAARLRDRVPR